MLGAVRLLWPHMRSAPLIVLPILVCLVACGRETVPLAPPLTFDTAQAVIRGPRGNSASLLLELALTTAQRSHGLSRRTALDSASGMFFRFDSIQPGDYGF